MLIVEAIPMWCPPGTRVLDLGAGTGRHAIWLAERGYEVDAIDASRAAIRELRAQAEARGLTIGTRVADIATADIDFASYGAVLCTYVLHFLLRERATALLERARAHAAPGALHAIAAITSHGEFFARSSHRERDYYPEPGEIAHGYRACDWIVHRDRAQERDAMEKHGNGIRMRNLISFTVTSAVAITATRTG